MGEVQVVQQSHAAHLTRMNTVTLPARIRPSWTGITGWALIATGLAVGMHGPGLSGATLLAVATIPTGGALVIRARRRWQRRTHA